MKKQFVIIFTSLAISLSAFAQKEFKIAAPAGRLNLQVSGATIEGYSGNDIIFSVEDAPEEKIDERAKGLKPINSSGFSDNTGLGLDITRNGEDIDVNTVGKNRIGKLKIKVPQQLKVSYKNHGIMHNTDFIVAGMKNEIEISAAYNNVKLDNISGPMNVNVIYGSVDAKFNTDIKGPVSIISVYGLVDVSLPAEIKSNIELNTLHGKLYAANEFKIVRTESPAMVRNQNLIRTDTNQVYISQVPRRTDKNSALTVVTGFRAGDPSRTRTVVSTGKNTVFIAGNAAGSDTGESIKGTINGGGLNLILISNYNNVYLRQK